MIYILLYTIILSINILQYHYVECNSTLSAPATIDSPSTKVEITNVTTEIPHTTEEILQIIRSSTVKISTEASDIDEVTKHLQQTTTTSSKDTKDDPQRFKSNFTNLIPPSKVEPKIDQDQISG